MTEETEPLEENIGLMFLDSGAHSLYTKHVMELGGLGHGAKDKATMSQIYAFYKTPEFFAYVDQYCEFVKANKDSIDHFVNVDAIFNPKLTWRTQQYIQKEHGLRPMPVVHHGTDKKWIDRYIEDGHDLIGLGGLGQEVTKEAYFNWADETYTHICPASNDYKPIVKTHGFAMTAYELLIRYPWWSVDSASWVKSGAFGMLYVPRMTAGKFDFGKAPYTISISATMPDTEKNQNKLKKQNRGAFFEKTHMTNPAMQKGSSFHSQPKAMQKSILQWLDFAGVDLGSVDENGQCLEKGVASHYSHRVKANLRFFSALQEWLPDWPWPFRTKRPLRKGFF